MGDLTKLAEAWQEWKLIEQDAQKKRRDIEDQISDVLKLEPGHEGTEHVTPWLKCTSRNIQRVDSDKLEALAAESGLTHHLSQLFRFKVEINQKTWKAAAPEITGPLLGAIETRPGRPSYSIDWKKVEA